MNCIVLAGGVPKPDEALYRHTRGGPKALLQIAGRPMVEHVVSALRKARHIDDIVLVGLGPEDGFHHPEGVVTLPRRASLSENLFAGIDVLRDDSVAAFCWSDIPLVDADMIDRFIVDDADPEADVSAGLVPREALQRRYPDAEDLWLRLREGQFVAADFGTFRPARAMSVRHHLEALMPQRKSSWRQARYVGIGLLLKYVTRRLSMAGFSSHLERRYGIRCSISSVADPELGLDVDSVAHLELCRRVLAGQA